MAKRLSLRLVGWRFSLRERELIDEPHQIFEPASAHFLQGLPARNASADLADVHLAGNLLVRAPDSQQRYNLPLAGCQGRESLLELRHHLLFDTLSAGALN